MHKEINLSLLPPLDKLKIPVIGSPLFIISNPDLVIAQCKAGIIGSFPCLNAREGEGEPNMLEIWLKKINEELDKYNQTPIDMLEEAKYSEQNLSRSKQEQETICIVCNILRRKAVQVYKKRKDIWEKQGFDCSFFQPTKYIGNMQIICQ